MGVCVFCFCYQCNTPQYLIQIKSDLHKTCSIFQDWSPELINPILTGLPGCWALAWVPGAWGLQWDPLLANPRPSPHPGPPLGTWLGALARWIPGSPVLWVLQKGYMGYQGPPDLLCSCWCCGSVCPPIPMWSDFRTFSMNIIKP